MTEAIERKERGVIFLPWAVQAILDGSKTQTRRVMSPQPNRLVDRTIPQRIVRWRGLDVMRDMHCPLGVRGDFLWVKEAAWLLETQVSPDPVAEWVMVGESLESPSVVAYQADMANPPPVPVEGQRWRRTAALHLPRCYARIVLEITDVRCERVQWISDADAVAESAPRDIVSRMAAARPRDVFAAAWDVIHGSEAWAEDLYVWAIAFRRVA